MCTRDTTLVISNTNNAWHRRDDAIESVYLRVCRFVYKITKQESPAVADKPARRESMPKIAPILRAYNVVADSTGLPSFV